MSAESPTVYRLVAFRDADGGAEGALPTGAAHLDQVIGTATDVLPEKFLDMLDGLVRVFEDVTGPEIDKLFVMLTSVPGSNGAACSMPRSGWRLNSQCRRSVSPSSMNGSGRLI